MRAREGEYEWADRLGPPWTAVKHAPSIVLGKQVVVTAFDSGPPRLSDDEAKKGWRQSGDVLITSPITSYGDIVGALSDEGGEIWVFDSSLPIPNFDAWKHMAGWCGVISFAPPEQEFPDPPPTWDSSLVDQDREWLRRMQARLREGLRRFRPLSFLRDDLLVTRDPVAVAEIDALGAKAR